MTKTNYVYNDQFSDSIFKVSSFANFCCHNYYVKSLLWAFEGIQVLKWYQIWYYMLFHFGVTENCVWVILSISLFCQKRSGVLGTSYTVFKKRNKERIISKLKQGDFPIKYILEKFTLKFSYYYSQLLKLLLFLLNASFHSIKPIHKKEK